METKFFVVLIVVGVALGFFAGKKVYDSDLAPLHEKQIDSLKIVLKDLKTEYLKLNTKDSTMQNRYVALKFVLDSVSKKPIKMPDLGVSNDSYNRFIDSLRRATLPKTRHN